MLDFDRATMLAHFSYADFVPCLRDALTADCQTPDRSHYDVGPATTLLLMPAWNARMLGVKTVTVAPGNREKQLPSVHATYLLMDSETGRPIARFDGKTLTNLRTAAASALASSMLSPPDAARLLMIGHGTLAPELIRAHASVRPIREVRVYGRSTNRVTAWLDEHGPFGDMQLSASRDLEDDVAAFADIVSCATTSATPVFPGRQCRPRQHIDLVGSYRPQSREADDDLMGRAFVLLDTGHAAVESGDIAIPLESGVLTRDRVLGTLVSAGHKDPTSNIPDGAITVFKSVGFALEDLTLAEFLYDRLAGGRT